MLAGGPPIFQAAPSTEKFPEATVTFPALGDIGNVGARILSQFAVTFDQQHQRVRFDAR